MNNRQDAVADPNDSKKRRVLPHELFGRFSAKSDFIRYFKENLQLYLPPDYM
jgi:hypothetical protein